MMFELGVTAVVREHGVEQRAEYTPLRHSVVERQGGVCDGAYPFCLGLAISNFKLQSYRGVLSSRSLRVMIISEGSVIFNVEL